MPELSQDLKLKNGSPTTLYRVEVIAKVCNGATRENLEKEYSEEAARLRIGEILGFLKPEEEMSKTTRTVTAIAKLQASGIRNPTQEQVNMGRGQPLDTLVDKRRRGEALIFRPLIDFVTRTGREVIKERLKPATPKPSCQKTKRGTGEMQPRLDTSLAKLQADLAKPVRTSSERRGCTTPGCTTPRKDAEQMEYELVQKPCQEYARSRGCDVLLWNFDGWPDNIIVYHGKVVLYAEYKRPGEDLEHLQKERFVQGLEYGWLMRGFNSVEDFKVELDAILGGIE
jgi:hypothetical protein